MEETHFMKMTLRKRNDRGDIRRKNWNLFQAIQAKNSEQAEKMLEGFKNEANSDEDDIRRIVNFKQGVLEVSAMILAAYLNNFEILQLLLRHGAQAKIKDRIGRTPLHYAAYNGSVEMVTLLIDKGAEVNGKIHITTWVHMKDAEVGDVAPMPIVYGRTPLHLSTAGLHVGSVQVLLEHGASVQCVDEAGLPPLLTLAEAALPHSDAQMRDYEKIIALLLDRKCDVNTTHPITGRNVLFQAIDVGSAHAVQLTLDHGINVFHTDSTGNNVLHAAARRTNPEILQKLLQTCAKMINAKNKDGETPLHHAAYAGARDALKILIDKGGDVSRANFLGVTVADAMFSFLPRPTSFITETLDTKFIPNEYSINEKQFNVTVDFRILSPADNDQQMSVIMALMNSVTFAQKSKIMLHPLIETFVRLKWVRLRAFFFLLLLVHFLYALSLSYYVTTISMGKYQTGLVWSNPVLITTSIIILVNLVMQTALEPKRFFEFEMWSSIASVAMSLAIAGWSCVSDHDHDFNDPEEWVRHVASYDILLTWVHLMFLIGKYPFQGHFTLMFYTVFRNVLKLIVFYACLVIGFCLSFSLQFHDPQFSNPGLSFVRTTVMLMGEYDYDTLFKNVSRGSEGEFPQNRDWLLLTSHIIFIVFILVGSIVLMNLMTGLAVNDIQSLQNEGNLRHMIKQAQFLSHIENILSRKMFFIPKRFLSERKRIPTKFRINPSAENRICESKYRNKSVIPFRLLESIVLLSVKNQKDAFKKQSETILMKDGITVCVSDTADKEAVADALSAMRTELRILSMRLNTLINNPDEEADARNSTNHHLSRSSNSSIFSFKGKKLRGSRISRSPRL